MLIANSWLTYMMSPPADVGPDTAPGMVQTWSAFANATWMPINIHRAIANVVFGGAIVGAYAAYRFLLAKTDEERAHYDWMGYIGNLIAIGALIILPFAGYYLGREIYEYNQQMGITMMGGFMSWLWIIQAFLIGGAVPCGKLLPVGRHGTDSRSRAVHTLHEIHVGRVDRGCLGVGDASHDDRQP